MMRLLVISERERTAIEKLVTFASHPEHHYEPGAGVAPPGDDPRFVLRFGDFRIVFSMTRIISSMDETMQGLWRHLSVSVPQSKQGKKAYPNPTIVVEIARLFGFQGTFDDWQVDMNDDYACMVVAEKVTEELNSSTRAKVIVE